MAFFFFTGNFWISPAFQGRKRMHEAIFSTLTQLFLRGYRRISTEIDERHYIGRKMLERCGFILEATLRKHQIIRNRNRNTCIYVILNSEWAENEIKLKKYLGILVNPSVKRAFDVETLVLQPKGFIYEKKE